jgi:3-phosphoshikimate 1-carboxyvinyltransferase
MTTPSHTVRITIPKKLKGTVSLPLSKSECNRLQIIHALTTQNEPMQDISNAQDSQVLQQLLARVGGVDSDPVYDCGPAGTTMRFLAAYFAGIPGKRILTGSARMKKRPLGILVNALRELGAHIEYKGEEGFAPIEITGTKLKGGQIELDGSVSSQFVTALLLIAPTLHNGLVIRFKGSVASMPYILMTTRIMERFHVYSIWDGDTISVSNQKYVVDEPAKQFRVEADWSAASYFYALAALSDEADIVLKGLHENSLQGDAVCALLFPFLGVSTKFETEGIRLTPNGYIPKAFAFDFEDTPDIVQTCAVVAAAKRIPLLMRGLNTLRVKETDRIHAVITELAKFGVVCREPGKGILDLYSFNGSHEEDITIETYEDHRMAMAFAPLAMLFPELKMKDPEVVRKSFPAFWDELRKLGASIKT